MKSLSSITTLASPVPTAGSRRLRRIAAALAVVGSVVTLAPSGGSATGGELPRNALAGDITAAADLAVEAYDVYAVSGDLDDYLEYAEHRTNTARLAARQLGYVEYDMVEAWQATSLEHQRAVLAAMTQVGVPYRSHTSIEDEGFDCSGLTFYSWQEVGYQLDRSSGDQIRAATQLDRQTAKAGDLVHYPGHVMMYLGTGDAIVHAIGSGRTVEIDTISGRRADSVRWGDPTV